MTILAFFYALPLLAFASSALANSEVLPTMPNISYPDTKRIDVVERHFGQTITDPYRWLENDVRSDKDVGAWVKAQNEATDTYLQTLPGREVFTKRLTALFDHETFTAPEKRGERYFYTRNSGLQNQAALYVRTGLDGAETILIDPNGWTEDGTTALAAWSVSDDGSHLAYAVQDGGTDWHTINILDVKTGKVLDDAVKWARFTEISWLKDGSGFFYSRYPDPEKGVSAQSGVSNHAIYYHAVGTNQSQDRLLYATQDQPNLINVVDVSNDGRYAMIYSTPGVGANSLSVVDLESEDWKPRKLIDDFHAEWSVIGNVGTTLFIMTSEKAERRKIVTLDLSEAGATFKDLVAEQEAVLTNAWMLGQRLIATYLVDAKTEVRRYHLDGIPDGVVELPGIGSAGGFRGSAPDDEAFFIFTSFNAPTTVYRYDVATNTSTVWAEPDAGFDFDRIIVEQKFYTSKDGTRVPMFVVRRKDVTAPAPTLLYGYGGFGISMIPYYNPAQMAWVEQGGVMAIANIRGGGEYGKAWHNAGRLDNKQNVFDDFIAAGEYLKAQAITSADGLAIHGESGGGLLVGAVTNQRPDLFAAVLAGVGVMDMLRYHKFTGGQLWMTDFGDPAVEDDFYNLLSYSPYHTIKAGKDYPAVLATTADTDDRVVPAHSFKYIAALQAEDFGPKPRLVRIETRAGHGAGKPMNKMIDEVGDLWAFAAHWTGLKVGAPK
ncbi:prolyl oligopeptidase family serine peptidase [Agrobacterium sp. rho-13.3]|uniref:prolyl oligopeptidase family serine peptidase n=1 Tax=Agrobacterium sp. rho-13.3 TaxID=3072980 RepID=UPI002A0CDADB|nr:prolyl oligopeptidase family serine peptidase [Agrobacterium sp. rho-13.3]MDX8306801.1 prolyl oligopeptidase family serine peptidase [Agrobacterium sp. rho-13.3]MDX8306868.1 prolyl oligopeptidase family serine peptidase [Agrobacterium sp. rho-13.3]